MFQNFAVCAICIQSDFESGILKSFNARPCAGLNDAVRAGVLKVAGEQVFGFQAKVYACYIFLATQLHSLA